MEWFVNPKEIEILKTKTDLYMANKNALEIIQMNQRMMQ